MSSGRFRKGGMRIGKTFGPVVKILTERTISNLVLQVTVRRRCHPHVDVDGFRAPEPLDLPFLQNAQKLDLHLQWQVTDLVEYQDGFSATSNQPASRKRAPV